eukprot:gene19418-25294_t
MTALTNFNFYLPSYPSLQVCEDYSSKCGGFIQLSGLAALVPNCSSKSSGITNYPNSTQTIITLPLEGFEVKLTTDPNKLEDSNDNNYEPRCPTGFVIPVDPDNSLVTYVPDSTSACAVSCKFPFFTLSEYSRFIRVSDIGPNIGLPLVIIVNKGYVINIPTDLLRKLAPAFKWGLIFLKLALATQGLGGIIPSLDADAMPSSPIDLDYLKSLSAAFANNNAMVTDLNHGSQNIINALFDSNSDFSNLDDLLGNNSNFALNTAYDKIYNLLRKEENLPYGAALQCTGLYPYKRYNKYENPEYLW